jgi:hypothetical protein
MKVESSSLNYNPHTIKMYNRKGVGEDPWLGVQDHAISIKNKTLVYGENRFPDTTMHSKSYKEHKGLNVYVGYYKKDICNKSNIVEFYTR